MESLFLKVVCIGFCITCVTIYYEEVLEYVQLKAYGNPYWLQVSQDCNCCYPNPDDSTLCGKCFETCSKIEEEEDEKEARNGDLVFGLAAKLQDVNRLLVLIASIHRNFPTTKLIIFDQENGTALAHQLISIRNVEVVNLGSIPGNGNGKVVNNVYTPFYLQKLVSRHRKVLWLTHDLEFLNAKLLETGPFRRSSKYAVTFISHDSSRKITTSGYRTYFPTSSVMPRFPLAVLLKDEARGLISWVERCASTPDCWECNSATGAVEDCTWMVLHQVASDAALLRHFPDSNGSINKQSWGPPECDFYCTMYLLGITVLAVLCFGVLALVLLKKSTAKKTA